MTLPPLPLDLSAVFAAQHALITVRQAREHGLSRATVARRIAIRQLDRPLPGVLRLLGAPPTPAQGVMAAVLASGGRAVASHRSASALHDLDGCPLGVVELSTTRRYRVSVPGAVVHHIQALEPADVTTIAGIPVTGLARTLCDLGSVVPVAAVERGLDDARRRGVSLRWLEQTATRLHRPGQAGTGVMLRLLAQAREEQTVRGSWFERLVEDCLRSPELPPLVRQYPVHDRRGALAGILDLAFPTLRLGVEAHSRQFHFGRVAEHSDENRDHRLARCGWEVLYVGWQQARQPSEVLALVTDAARHRRRLAG